TTPTPSLCTTPTPSLCPKTQARPLVVLGGMHATLNYKEAVRYADYVMLGDADESIVEFIEALQGLGEEVAPVQIPGLAYLSRDQDGTEEVILTKERPQPTNIEIIPNRALVYEYAKKAKKYNTLWPQVHASRGCSGTCDYCCVIAHFGRKVRTRSPEAVVEDIRQAVAFHKGSFPPRLNRAVWLTDDNFAQSREWAISVLKAIIASELTAPITVQARWELGFDDEMLALMKQANFFEISLGIEFIDDASFVRYHKRCTRERIEKSIANIQAHGIGVRGLFILGSDEDTPGVGERLGQFIIDNKIHGCLIQSMFFVPGTPVYEQNKDKLLHQIWERFNGSVVHKPKNMSPVELQQEMIDASRKAYSARRLLHSLLHAKGVFKILAAGETVWHAHLRSTWKKQLPLLREYGSYHN
ncbi:MAG: B12-binding domain-containing radical SAM protein, partial [Coriobacteriia bacterium]|nr:B12-binding domain-containing radical SAM protein [Coriobacteriia bacterium]